MNLKHSNVISNSKGHRTSSRFKISVNVLNRSKSYSHAHIRIQNRTFSRFWIRTINGYCRPCGYSYSEFMGTPFAHVLDKKSVSTMLSSDFNFFNRFLDLSSYKQKF